MTILFEYLMSLTANIRQINHLLCQQENFIIKVLPVDHDLYVSLCGNLLVINELFVIEVS